MIVNRMPLVEVYPGNTKDETTVIDKIKEIKKNII